MPAFDRFPQEGNLIGRLLAGYGELELELCSCLATVTDDLDGAAKMLFGTRGEKKRIDTADTAMKEAFAKAKLKKEYSHTIECMHWCRELRNQYAHCNWYDTLNEGLCFVNLEEVAKIVESTIPLEDHRVPINVALLKQQEEFFDYVRKCFWFISEAYLIFMGKGPKQALWKWPEIIDKPAKHN
jgi:hypothetical protein